MMTNHTNDTTEGMVMKEEGSEGEQFVKEQMANHINPHGSVVTTNINTTSEFGKEQMNKTTTNHTNDVEDISSTGTTTNFKNATDEDVPTSTSTTTGHSIESSFSLATTYGKRPSRCLFVSTLCNIALLLYAHIGLSAVILSNIERNSSEEPSDNNNNNTTTDGACTTDERDIDRWYNAGGALQKPMESSYCGIEYPNNGNRGCLTNAACTTDCFVNVWNYTLPCASCFGTIPLCSLHDGCAVICQIDNGVNDECQTCTKSCNDAFQQCSGLTLWNVTDDDTNMTNTPDNPSNTDASSTNSSSSSSVSSRSTNVEICAAQQANASYIRPTDNDDTTTTTNTDRNISNNNNYYYSYYVVYELKFVSAIQRAWTSNAQLLAVIVIVFSGVWPYTKSIIMVVLWYCYNNKNKNNTSTTTDDDINTNSYNSSDRAMSMYRRRHAMIIWLKRLGKWSFVDVYIIVLLLIGLTIRISVNNGTVPLVLKGEPRPAIIAFLIATIWSFVHLEVITEYHIHQLQQVHSSTYPRCAIDGGSNSNMDTPTAITNHNNKTPATTTTQQYSTLTSTNLYDALRIYPSHRCCGRNSTETELTTTTTTTTVWKFRSTMIGRGLLLILYGSTITLLIAGSSIFDVVHFTSYIPDDDVTTTNEPGCIQAYNLYTLGTKMISHFFLYQNSAVPGVYVLFISYILFVIVCPLLVHTIHIVTLLFSNMPQQKFLCRLADVCWTYASIEVLLLGIFAVQYKFEELVTALAGNDGSQFFGMRAELREGFYILIGYSVLGSICHFIFQCTATEYYDVHPFQRLQNMFGAVSHLQFLFIDSDEKVQSL